MARICVHTVSRYEGSVQGPTLGQFLDHGYLPGTVQYTYCNMILFDGIDCVQCATPCAPAGFVIVLLNSIICRFVYTRYSNDFRVICFTHSKPVTNGPECRVLTVRQTRRLCGEETTTGSPCVTRAVSISNYTT